MLLFENDQGSECSQNQAFNNKIMMLFLLYEHDQRWQAMLHFTKSDLCTQCFKFYSTKERASQLESCPLWSKDCHMQTGQKGGKIWQECRWGRCFKLDMNIKSYFVEIIGVSGEKNLCIMCTIYIQIWTFKYLLGVSIKNLCSVIFNKNPLKIKSYWKSYKAKDSE